MNAERTPLADRSPLAAPLEAVTRLVLRSPGVVLSGAVMLAVLSVLVTVNGLSFKTSRLDLLNPRSEYNQRWLAYLAEFGQRDDAVIVVRSDDPAALTAAIDDLASQLQQQPELFESIFFRRDLSALQSKAIHFLPESELAKTEQLVRHGAALVPRDGHAADAATALARLNDRLAHVGAGSPGARAEVEAEYQRVAGMALAALAPSAGGDASGGSRPPLTDPILPLADSSIAQHFGSQYLLADKGRIGFVLLKLKLDETEFARGSKAIGKLRQTIDAASSRHPQAWIGLTGMPVIEFDEMQASQTDMVWTSALSMIGVFALFIAGYGGLRHSLLANLVLLLATAYSFGFVTLAVGHLNILSAALGAVLIGLGIDFGIHYLACYLKLRGQGCDEQAALIRTSIEVGPGMFTGGVTTAAAFFMAAMTDFLGIRELGLVAGGSILLCLAATIVILPPLVLVVDRSWPIGAVPTIVPAGRWFKFTGRWPRLAMGGCLAVTLLVGLGAVRLRYDHNLLNLQPRHLESADIERQLFTQLEDSVWFAVSLCDTPEELLARKAKFEALPSVAKTEEIASLLPQPSAQQARLIDSIHKNLAALPGRVPQAPPADPQHLRREIVRAQTLLAKETPYETAATALLGQLRAALSAMPPATAAERLSMTQARMAEQSWQQLAALRGISDQEPPQLADLPPELVDRFVGIRHKLLLKVYARGNVWDMDKLAAFVRDVESIDPAVTGHPVQTCYASRHMQQSYIFTGLYALAAVFVLLWIDLRSLTHSLLAMTPLALGFVQMCGLLGWLNIPLNPANMIVLPVILGIGVDHGVHLVHAWRQQRGRFVLSDSTAVAVLLTATTTTASFGVLILARHQGLQSLGQVLTLGVTTCLFSSIVFFPALLAWLTSGRAADVVAESPPAALAESAVPTVWPKSANEACDAEQIEDQVAALVLAASESPDPDLPFHVPQALAALPPAIPRRRAAPLEPSTIPRPPEPPDERRRDLLSHLAGVRQSER
jgi:hopanoid biosynthesis associated RND transporter like protein HpnN